MTVTGSSGLWRQSNWLSLPAFSATSDLPPRNDSGCERHDHGKRSTSRDWVRFVFGVFSARLGSYRFESWLTDSFTRCAAGTRAIRSFPIAASLGLASPPRVASKTYAVAISRSTDFE